MIASTGVLCRPEALRQDGGVGWLVDCVQEAEGESAALLLLNSGHCQPHHSSQSHAQSTSSLITVSRTINLITSCYSILMVARDFFGSLNILLNGGVCGCVLFAEQVLNILEQYVISEGYEYPRLDGSTPEMKRVQLVKEFNTDPTLFIFLISTK